ncbi:hypothetical protein E7T06_05510 [Deinococcus sp. Arct2-2]|uniref:hypothetical protein n=1 Tax=Deinococcus sp. Arct2-2 TaxID=2568653 RepID=UPI0010A506D8|nr:hypothetical protein [Deinococcus sp. Arct2-2]THF70809.1 hypothetical protein E7T06_05510 [Deinococcus sp. Arct2-2]
MSQNSGGERRTELDISLVCTGPPETWWAEVRVRGEASGRTFTSIAAWLDYLRQVAEPAGTAQADPVRRGLR